MAERMNGGGVGGRWKSGSVGGWLEARWVVSVKKQCGQVVTGKVGEWLVAKGVRKWQCGC